MKYTCPHCGNQDEISASALQAQRGTVMCPVCLNTFKVSSNGHAEALTEADEARLEQQHDTKKPADDVFRPAELPTVSCEACHSVLNSDITYCPNCGHKIGTPVKPPKPPKRVHAVPPPIPSSTSFLTDSLVSQAIRILSLSYYYSGEYLQEQLGLNDRQLSMLEHDLEVHGVLSPDRNGQRNIRIPHKVQQTAQMADTDDDDDEKKTKKGSDDFWSGCGCLILIIVLGSIIAAL